MATTGCLGDLRCMILFIAREKVSWPKIMLKGGSIWDQLAHVA
jgi:hypothetical protein